MLQVDGTTGEGGGQILRTSLGLSLCTGTPFHITGIRGGRPKPGLMRQHLTAVRAAAEISGAELEGDELRSTDLTFVPGDVQTGKYHFAVGTAGSAMLVLQTVLPALLTASGPSKLYLRGGTHNPYAPPFDFLARSFLPQLAKTGAQVEAHLDRHGFHPAGGGTFRVYIDPVEKLEPFELLERGETVSRRARALVSGGLPTSIARREVSVVGQKLSWPGTDQHIEVVHSDGPGNVVFAELESEHVTEVATGFGEKGKAAEKVAGNVTWQMRRYMAANVPVGYYLADQLLVPLALAGGGAFRTLAPSLHTETNAKVIEMFLPVKIDFESDEDDRACTVTITSRD